VSLSNQLDLISLLLFVNLGTISTLEFAVYNVVIFIKHLIVFETTVTRDLILNAYA